MEQIVRQNVIPINYAFYFGLFYNTDISMISMTFCKSSSYNSFTRASCFTYTELQNVNFCTWSRERNFYSSLTRPKSVCRWASRLSKKVSVAQFNWQLQFKRCYIVHLKMPWLSTHGYIHKMPDILQIFIVASSFTRATCIKCIIWTSIIALHWYEREITSWTSPDKANIKSDANYCFWLWFPKMI